MRQILPHSVWIGHAGDGHDAKAVLDAGIQAVVQLAAEEPPLAPPRDLIFCRFPLVDGSDNAPKLLSLSILTVVNLLEKHVPTLVCCGGGMSRAPAVVAAALSEIYQEKPDDCLKQIAEHQPHDVTPGFWDQVKSFLATDRY